MAKRFKKTLLGWLLLLRIGSSAFLIAIPIPLAQIPVSPEIPIITIPTPSPRPTPIVEPTPDPTPIQTPEPTPEPTIEPEVTPPPTEPPVVIIIEEEEMEPVSEEDESTESIGGLIDNDNNQGEPTPVSPIEPELDDTIVVRAGEPTPVEEIYTRVIVAPVSQLFPTNVKNFYDNNGMHPVIKYGLYSIGAISLLTGFSLLTFERLLPAFPMLGRRWFSNRQQIQFGR